MAPISTNFVTGSDVVAKAGSGYNTAFNAYIGSAMMRAESMVNLVGRYDFSAAAGSNLIGSSFKPFLTDMASSAVAIEAIEYDIASYPTRIVAEDMINVNRDILLRGLNILKDIKAKEFLGIR